MTIWAGVEENRLVRAGEKLPSVTNRYGDVVRAATETATEGSLAELGRTLWQTAVADAPRTDPADDRALYWARLAVRRAVEHAHPRLALGSFEWASRGLDDVVFSGDARYRILISGFDPFLLDEDITQSNPSGLAALALDGSVLPTSRGPAEIQAVVMPVRFGDFDEGLVEAFFKPQLTGASLDLVVTISMGRPGAFHLERFPGRRRSAQVPDNTNELTGASASDPRVPRLGDRLLEGPEFVEFSLPAAAMAAVDGRWPVRDNREVTTLERGTFRAGSLDELRHVTAVSGSGGGYLSNEISYRTVLLARTPGAVVPIGHLHTPRVAGYDPAMEADIVAEIRSILVAGVEALAD